MIKKNIKAILFASLIAAMILPFSVMDVSAAPNENANDIAKEKGKLFIKDKNQFKGLTQEEFTDLARNHSSMTTEKKNEIKGQIDKLSDRLQSLSEKDGIWIVSIGTDYENQTVDIAIDRTGLTEQKLKSIENKIRGVIGPKTDLTISYADPLYLACSQTGDCNPIQGGTKISVGGNTCSMGYKATYNGDTGFVTAGHCSNGSTGTAVGNPNVWNSLGTVIANTFYYGTWCDCAFVENTQESTSSKVYNGQTVSGFLFPTMYDWLEFEGTASQGVQGGITDTYETIYPKACSTCPTVQIKGVVETTGSTQGGDSGGSVIESTTGTPKFAGTIITDAGHYTPYYRITNAFPGINLG